MKNIKGRLEKEYIQRLGKSKGEKMKGIYAHDFGRGIKVKEYWTDTIIENLFPAGADVARRTDPVRIYIADDVDKETMNGVEERATIMKALIDSIQKLEEENKKLKSNHA